MKVLLTCATPSFTGPAERMLEDAAVLRQAGHEVTLGIDTVRTDDLAKIATDRGFELAPLGLCRLFGPLQLARDVSRLSAMLRAGRFDTVLAHFSHDHHVALLASAGMRDRARVVRSLELVSGARPGLARSLPFARTDRFVVPSAEHARALLANHGIDRTDVLPGRVDGERFFPGPSRMRAELGIPEDAPVAGIVSRMKPERRHRDVVRAFAKVANPAARLVIIGRGEGEPEVRRAVAEARIEDRTVFAGYRKGEALVDAYRALDVKVWLAPGNDGTCRAVLEAMAAGSAVLGGRFGAVAEAVVDGTTGRLCDPDDPAGVAESLSFLLEDRGRARAFGAAGRARALAVYTPARRAAGVLALLERAWHPAEHKERTWPTSTPT